MYVGTGLAIIWGKEHLVKHLLIFTLDKVIYFKGTVFLQNISSLHKIGWRPAEKKLPGFFHHLDLRFL
jgi:hypothetical protein